MSAINKKSAPRRKRPTTGFSELNKRTYEASSYYKNDSSSNQNFNQNSNFNTNNNSFGVNDYSRQTQNGKYSKARLEQEKKSRMKKALIIAAAIIASLFLIVGVACAIISNNLNSGMDNIGLTPTSLDKPFYMVLMGVDSSDERKVDGGTDSDFRSDSIILARIAANEKKVTLLSLHRDIEVDMGEYGTQKLNAAHSIGGPEMVIKCVSKICGVDINHYAEINFDGFKAAVDDLGGVMVNVSIEIIDPLAGGFIGAGEQVLNGEQALILCRARHAFDDYGDGDKYRAANQRLVLSSIAKQVLSSDILKIAQVATDLSKYIKTDLSLNDIIGLAQLMKDINSATDVYSAMTPTEGVYEDGVWYEKLDTVELNIMMKRMDQGLPPSEETIIDRATGTVLATAGSGNWSGSITVKNGTNITGLASDASGKIYTLGFTTDVGNASTQDYTETLIIYNDEEKKDAALAIRDKLGCGKVQKNTEGYSFASDILVIIGTDYSLN